MWFLLHQEPTLSSIFAMRYHDKHTVLRRDRGMDHLSQGVGYLGLLSVALSLGWML